MAWSPHEVAVTQEMHVLAILQVNGAAMSSVLLTESMEYLHSIDCIKNGEWHRERGFPVSFAEGMVRFHKVGQGK